MRKKHKDKSRMWKRACVESAWYLGWETKSALRRSLLRCLCISSLWWNSLWWLFLQRDKANQPPRQSKQPQRKLINLIFFWSVSWPFCWRRCSRVRTSCFVMSLLFVIILSYCFLNGLRVHVVWFGEKHDIFADKRLDYCSLFFLLD